MVWWFLVCMIPFLRFCVCESVFELRWAMAVPELYVLALPLIEERSSDERLAIATQTVILL